VKPWDTVIIWGYAFQVAELWLFGVVSVVAWLWGVVVLWPIDRTKRDRPADRARTMAGRWMIGETEVGIRIKRGTIGRAKRGIARIIKRKPTDGLA